MSRNKEHCLQDDAVAAHDLHCSNSSCIFCLLKEPTSDLRQSLLTKYFKELPTQQSMSSAQLSFVLTGLCSFAMAQPNKADLVESGVLECMASLIWKGLHNRRWLLQDLNIYIPYYAAHVIGTYTMNREDFAERSVKEGVIPPMIELLRGRLTWVEQRVAVRAVGHLASYGSTFLSVAAFREGEVLELAMKLSVCCVEIVYTHFLQFEEKRLKYHRDLLTKRAIGNYELEARKAEEWASQLQCWSLQLINCFAFKEKYMPTICRPSFLNKLADMWGGLANEVSPAGLGLLRTICEHKFGRISIAACPIVVKALQRIARSSDDWQYMAVECLLLLLQDPKIQHSVLDMATIALVDIAEMPSLLSRSQKKLGDVIVETLLQDDAQTPSAFPRGSLSSGTQWLLDELASHVQRTRWEKGLSEHELLARQQVALELKLQGNTQFMEGDVHGALDKYTEALGVCPCRNKKERVVLYSNRAQCHLLLQDAESTISDTTRALCLSRPVNCHANSLWRRAQAYDMICLPKESLLDAIMFINETVHATEKGLSLCNQPSSIHDYAELLVKKQMKATWLFKDASLKHGGCERCLDSNVTGTMSCYLSSSSLSIGSTITSTATRITGMSSTVFVDAGMYERQAQCVPSQDDSDCGGSVSSSQQDITMDGDVIVRVNQDESNAHFAFSDCGSTIDAASSSTIFTPPSSDHRYTEQVRFTPRSRKLLYSLHRAEKDNDVSNELQQSLLLPTIREEIHKHQALPGHLDTEMLKKSIYELIQKNFSFDKNKSTDKLS